MPQNRHGLTSGAPFRVPLFSLSPTVGNQRLPVFFFAGGWSLHILNDLPQWHRTEIGRDMYRFRRLSLVMFLISISGCAKPPQPESGADPSAAPVITVFSPSNGPTGEAYPIQVTLEGRGFAELGNVVTFGGIPSQPLESSEEGTRITFWVPKEAPSRGEVPPMVLSAGEYEVTVTTEAGTSDSVIFTLTRGG